ncbi:TetR/AcrR family transcriptional regulator [Tersicoccus sp. MR15.9]|uniref:TetR/AcrR family transcriptional regulator n=1 Tax=Tersicoccus mangrovi TaxID=3121635 RepID=UPI002FE5956E
MPRVSDAHRQQMIDRIMEATFARAQQRGLHEISMADIIDASGLSAGAIYGYFSGKDELIRAVAHRAFEVRLTALAAASQARPVRPPAEVLGDLLGALAAPRDTGLVVQVWALATVSEPMAALAHEAYGRVSAAVAGYLTAWFAAGADGPRLSDDEAAQRAALFTPAIVGLLQAWIVRPVVAPGQDQDYEDATRAVLTAIAAAG